MTSKKPGFRLLFWQINHIFFYIYAQLVAGFFHPFEKFAQVKLEQTSPVRGEKKHIGNHHPDSLGRSFHDFV